MAGVVRCGPGESQELQAGLSPWAILYCTLGAFIRSWRSREGGPRPDSLLWEATALDPPANIDTPAHLPHPTLPVLGVPMRGLAVAGHFGRADCIPSLYPQLAEKSQTWFP